MLFFLTKQNNSAQRKKNMRISAFHPIHIQIMWDKIELMGRNCVQNHVALSLWMFLTADVIIS